MSSIGNSINLILQEIEAIKNKYNIKQQITLIAVSKNRTTNEINEAYNSGQKIFGENRVQEAILKIDELKKSIQPQWHLIGHLQTNKAIKAVEYFDCLQSVDSIKLIDTIYKGCKDYNKKMPILLQINSSFENSKSGCSPSEVEVLIDHILANKYNDLIDVQGIMTIGPLTNNSTAIIKSFSLTRSIFESIKNKYKNEFTLTTVSMGMSSDYEIAIKEGSTMIRIGTKLFGERIYK